MDKPYLYFVMIVMLFMIDLQLKERQMKKEAMITYNNIIKIIR